MIICTDAAIKLLGTPGAWERYLHCVSGDRITLLQLSDLHLQIHKGGTNFDGLATTLRAQLQSWEHEAGVPLADGLLLSGDILDATFITPKTGKRRIERYVESYKHAANLFHSVFFPKTIPDPRRVIAIPGNHDVVWGGNKIGAHSGPYACDAYEVHFARAFVDDTDITTPAANAAVDCPRLCLFGACAPGLGGKPDQLNGVVAVIGLDSNHNQYRGTKSLKNHGLAYFHQLRRLENLVTALSTVITQCPLHICVAIHHQLLPIWEHDPTHSLEVDTANVLARVTLDARSIIDSLQRSYASLITHGHMHKTALQQVSYLPLELGSQPRLLSIVSCPSYAEDRGAAVLTFDVYAGQASIQIITPKKKECLVGTTVSLTSASRIPSREMRLYRELMAWLTPGTELPSGRNRTLIGEPWPDVERLSAFRDALARRWDQCGWVQVSGLPTEKLELPVSQEDVPHAKKYFLLVLLKGGPSPHILLNNHVPMRTSEFSSWDTLLFPAFSELKDELEHTQRDLVRSVERLRLDSNKDFKTRRALQKSLIEKLAQIRKEDWEKYEGEFRLLGTKPFVKFSPTDGRPQRYEYNLVSLDAFAIKDEHGGFTKIFESVDEVNKQDVSCGPRLDARTTVSDTDEVVRPVPLGLVWYPIGLPLDSLLNSLNTCPPMAARNADVISWVVGVLEDIWKKEGRRFPPWLLLGEHDPVSTGAITVLSERPFEQPTGVPARDADDFPNSLCQGLREVQFEKSGQLKGIFPYAKADLLPVVLQRDGDYIKVLSKDEKDLGVLRPTQRYVLKKGLERVRWLSGEIERIYRLEGYMKVQLRGGSLLAVLPPVIEAILEEDRELPGRGEFLVCDGNHRIVQHCWTEGKPTNAVLAKTDFPYYAHPFGSREWRFTAENEQVIAPDLYSKYAPRRFPGNPRRDSYRTYFRDFNTGFKNIGGQGGRAI